MPCSVQQTGLNFIIGFVGSGGGGGGCSGRTTHADSTNLAHYKLVANTFALLLFQMRAAVRHA